MQTRFDAKFRTFPPPPPVKIREEWVKLVFRATPPMLLTVRLWTVSEITVWMAAVKHNTFRLSSDSDISYPQPFRTQAFRIL